MRPQILVFGGTTEARKIIKSGLPMYYSAATTYGTEITGKNNNVINITGRMDRDRITTFLKENNIKFVIDATHPYAEIVSQNIKEACTITKVRMVRVVREETEIPKETIVVESFEKAVEYLNTTNGNILLTVGSKELHHFTKVKDYKNRIYARILPTTYAIDECYKLEIDAQHTIAIQGPFSEEMNTALLLHTKAKILVTKDSGKTGGTGEKITSAQKNGVKIVMIKRPSEIGLSVHNAIEIARKTIKEEKTPMFPLLKSILGAKVVIIGGGSIAKRRSDTLLKCGANVHVITREIKANFDTRIHITKKSFEETDLNNAILAVAATNNRETNKLIAQTAKKVGIEISVCDSQEESTYFFPALVTSDNISVSVSSSGTSPSDTRQIADKLRTNLPVWVENL